MRRKDREVTDRSEILAIMKQCDVCRIAFACDEYPYIVPMNFGLTETDGEVTLYFHSALEGKKLRVLQQNPKVGFEMDRGHELIVGQSACDCTMAYESVIGYGTMEILGENEKEKALGFLVAHYRESEEIVFEKAILDKTAVLKLTVEKMTAKRLTK